MQQTSRNNPYGPPYWRYWKSKLKDLVESKPGLEISKGFRHLAANLEKLQDIDLQIELKKHTWIAKRKGISVRGSYWNSTITVYTINENGSYSVGWGIHPYSRELDDDEVKRIEVYEPVKSTKKNRITKDNLPEPFEFSGDRYTKLSRDNGRLFKVSQIASAKVVSIVSIKDDGTVSDEEIATPGQDVWFHLDCVGDLGATFNFITNGEKVYALNRYSKGDKKITKVKKPKKSVDLSKLSELDKEFVMAAIDMFLSSDAADAS